MIVKILNITLPISVNISFPQQQLNENAGIIKTNEPVYDITNATVD